MCGVRRCGPFQPCDRIGRCAHDRQGARQKADGPGADRNITMLRLLDRHSAVFRIKLLDYPETNRKWSSNLFWRCSIRKDGSTAQSSAPLSAWAWPLCISSASAQDDRRSLLSFETLSESGPGRARSPMLRCPVSFRDIGRLPGFITGSRRSVKAFCALGRPVRG